MKPIILIAGLTFSLVALAAESGAELFQKAVTQERAAGNLEEAIKLYQRVAKEFASDRALAAKALVQAARCYEKLGQDKAVKIYEQVARDFGDQREFAATASARLAALRQPAPVTMTARKIEPPVVPGTVPVTDGQRVLYQDPATGALMISDMAGKDKRAILESKSTGPFRLFASRDFSVVAMDSPRLTGPHRLAVVKTDGTNYHELGQLESYLSSPCSWSWDNRYILVCEPQPDGSTRVIRISVADGQTRELFRSRGAATGCPSLSPDGRFVAYSEGSPGSSKVFILSSEGGEPRLASDDASFLDWTRDGRFLAVASGHTDSRALYLLPIKDGQTAGAPVFIRYGSIEAGTTIANGALMYTSTPPSSTATTLGALGPDGHVSAWRPLNLASGGPNTTAGVLPAWSPDGSRISYVTRTIDAGQARAIVRIHNVSNGDDRELFGSSGVPLCIWATQHANLFCAETGGPTTEILSVAVDTGHVEQLGSVPGFRVLRGVSGDDSTLYMSALSPKVGVVRFETATREESVVERGIAHSPDGSWVYTMAANRRDVEIHPAMGSDWKKLVSLRYEAVRIPHPFAFSPDGRWFFYPDKDATGNDSLFRVPTAGGEPERLGDFPSHARAGILAVSPDGHKIIFADWDQFSPPETWLLENYVPKQQAAR